jgi:hypothetical protein
MEAEQTPSKPNRRGNGKRKLIVNDENRQKVQALAAYGNTNDQIAKLFGVSDRLIKYRFAEQLALGRAQGKANLLKTGYDMAVGMRDPQTGEWKAMPDRALLIFLLKARCGLRETERVLPLGIDGKPIQPVQVNVSGDGESAKPVLIVPGMWTEELWNARARDHQRMLMSRQYNQTMQGKKDM